MAKTKMSPEQIEFLQNQLEEDFGEDLKKLENQVKNDIFVMGKQSPKTMKARDDLLKRIMAKKHERDRENGL